jgi:hypothetical protein
MTGKYYIYRHIRPDKNEVFYIGRGMEYKRSTPLRRAYATKRRNDFWNRIVNKNSGKFDVEIMFWAEERDIILEKEKEFIKLYGLRKNGGTLVNLTDGGDGSLGMKHSDETKSKLSEIRKSETWRYEMLRDKDFIANSVMKRAHLPGTMLGKHHSEETKSKMREKKLGALHPEAKKVLNSTTGEIYGCVDDAAKAIGRGKWALYKHLSGERKNMTTLRYI